MTRSLSIPYIYYFLIFIKWIEYKDVLYNIICLFIETLRECHITNARYFSNYDDMHGDNNNNRHGNKDIFIKDVKYLSFIKMTNKQIQILSKTKKSWMKWTFFNKIITHEFSNILGVVKQQFSEIFHDLKNIEILQILF